LILFFKAITTCNPNPCGAHGTCQQAVLPTNALAVLCVCEAQWTGQYCDVNVAGRESFYFIYHRIRVDFFQIIVLLIFVNRVVHVK
jgi:hypothetical protein